MATEVDDAAYSSYEALLSRIFAESRRALKPTGHLIFSFANRESDAWVAVMRARHDAGFRAAGSTVVQSENETDHAKRAVRACTLGLILDLVRAQSKVDQWAPVRVPDSPEGSFLQLVGETLLKYVGGRNRRWVDEFLQASRQHPFIAARPTPECC